MEEESFPRMSESVADADPAQNRVIEQIVELQREFYFENKGKESERRRLLREIIDRATGTQGNEQCGLSRSRWRTSGAFTGRALLSCPKTRTGASPLSMLRMASVRLRC
jgi:hypothetical protein